MYNEKSNCFLGVTGRERSSVLIASICYRATIDCFWRELGLDKANTKIDWLITANEAYCTFGSFVSDEVRKCGSFYPRYWATWKRWAIASDYIARVKGRFVITPTGQELCAKFWRDYDRRLAMFNELAKKQYADYLPLLREGDYETVKELRTKLRMIKTQRARGASLPNYLAKSSAKLQAQFLSDSKELSFE